ncbi:MCE family protein [Nocardioides stalactiti]|uniref:MCE family protein n=1 Tax=Nocardioides stalactiti TaxID=2755356 RepID=UPI001600E7BA|nr:MCE family protein [Nocardioides stalactiti]
MSARPSSRPLLGLGYLVVVAALVLACIAAYNKDLPWQDRAEVSLETQQVGLGLRVQSDVEFQGLIVGEVREVTTDGTTARVVLGIDPDLMEQIPADVDAVVVPKTLFGDKYVDLRSTTGPATGDTPVLEDGDTIEQTRTAVELGEIFDRLVPALQTLDPARVSAVLGSLADALDGRGESIARTLRSTETLLARLSPSYDDLVADVRLLATTASVYADAAPDFLSILDDSAAISRENLVAHEDDFAAVLDAAAGTAAQAEHVLRRNRDDLVELSGRARPVLEVLERYSGTVPCILRALDAGNKLANLASGVRGPYIALSVDMIVDQAGYDYPNDLPTDPGNEAFVGNLPPEVPGWAPHCPLLPKRVTALGETPQPYSQQPYGQTFDLGERASGDARADEVRAAPPAREVMARAIAAEALDVDLADVPGYAALLVLPLTEGEVTVR